ncbi:MAG TPA: hypothetical protein DDW27_19410 [Bacteroidales bacterium]|nr:hypothetical protein [Bacteroidales bacterium]
MIVNVLPVVTFTCSDPDYTFYAGTNITFTAGGGTFYDFLINDASIQNGSDNTYSTSELTDGQVVSVIVTSAEGCSATSAGILVNVIGCADFSLSFPAGWSWFSVNTLLDDMSLNSVLSSGFTDGDYIKNQTTFSFYSASSGWVGSMFTIDPADLYIIRVQNTAGINFCGIPVEVNSTPISLVEGWNWIGYTPSFPLPIGDALGSISSVEGDYIKNQILFAEYYSTGWFGSLTQLSPGEGYMLRMTNDDELIYPDSPAKSASEETIIQQKYSFSPHRYEFNGSITANVLINGIPAGSEKDILYAYADDEIRGIAHGLYIDVLDSYIYPLMIHSNTVEGENIHFRYYNAESKRFYNCSETITFKADMIISTPLKSFKLNVISDQKSMMNDVRSDIELTAYPNPFNDYLQIEFKIPEISNVRLSVSDQYGKTIKVLLDQELDPENYSIRWMCNEEPAGIYVIRLRAGNRLTVKKVVLIP